jgi:hypothetical protein
MTELNGRKIWAPGNRDPYETTRCSPTPLRRRYSCSSTTGAWSYCARDSLSRSIEPLSLTSFPH